MILVSAPAEEPLTLAEVKEHLRETSTDEDSLIASLIVAARQYAESFTQRALVTQTWKKNFDCFPSYFDIPKAPLISVISIKYLDTDGNEQTLAADQYRVDAPSFSPGKITPAFNVSWPDTYDLTDSVTVEFVAGYGAAGQVPETIKAAMKLYISHLYDNRTGEEVPSGIEGILYPSKVFQ